MSELIQPDPGAITITKKGLEFQREITKEQWVDALAFFKGVHETYHLAVADLIRHGQEQFGEEAVAEALEQLEFPQIDFKRSLAISRVPIGLRQNEDGLTAEHFYVVGNVFEEEPTQRRWLKLASENKLTARELRRSIEAGKLVKDNASRTGRGSAGFVTIENVMNQFQAWEKQVGGDEHIASSWSREAKEQFLEETAEIARVRAVVSQSLADNAE